MKKTPLIVFAIGCVVLIASAVIVAVHFRYNVVAVEGRAYEVDRLTGRTWELRGRTRTLVQDPAPPSRAAEARPLPAATLAAVEVTEVGIPFGSYGEVTIYNGSAWTIQQVVLRVTVTEASDSETRSYARTAVIDPLTTRQVAVTLARDYAAGARVQCTVGSALGWPPSP